MALIGWDENLGKRISDFIRGPIAPSFLYMFIFVLQVLSKSFKKGLEWWLFAMVWFAAAYITSTML